MGQGPLPHLAGTDPLAARPILVHGIESLVRLHKHGHRLMQPRKIILAYNADAGLFNAAKDWASKLLWPDSNPCTLCRITYDVRGMLHPWKKYLESLGCPVLFLHRPEFGQHYAHLDLPLPVILADFGRGPEVLLTTGEITSAATLEGLITATQEKLEVLSRNGAAAVSAETV